MSKAENILEFISVEHQNELVSIANLKNELGFLQELDEIFGDVKHAFSPSASSDLQCIVAT